MDEKMLDEKMLDEKKKAGALGPPAFCVLNQKKCYYENIDTYTVNWLVMYLF